MEYVEQRNGSYYVAGTRISLDSIVYAFLRGETPKDIQDSFPGCLTLEQIAGALEFYRANKAIVDEYLKHQHAEFERMRAEDRSRRPEFYARMEAARRTLREKGLLTSEPS